MPAGPLSAPAPEAKSTRAMAEGSVNPVQAAAAPRRRLGTTFFDRVGSAGGGLAHGRRQRDAGRTEGEAGGRTWRGANDEAFAVVLDLGLGQRVEIGDDLRPGTRAPKRGDAVLQRLLQHQREEAAEHVTADGLVELVEDRPGRE